MEQTIARGGGKTAFEGEDSGGESLKTEGKRPVATAPDREFARGFTRYPDGSSEVHYTPKAAKTAFALAVNVQGLVEKYGQDQCGFLTLTFPDQPSPAEIGRRFHSLRTRVISERYRGYLAVIERGAIAGNLHLHLIVATTFNVARGCIKAEFDEQNYRSASPELRAEWKFLRETLPNYGFGRHELLPIWSDPDSLGKYVSKYLVKHGANRIKGDRGMRLVRSSAGDRVATSRFTWNSDFQRDFRAWCWSFSQECGMDEGELLGRLRSARPLMRAFLQDRYARMRAETGLPAVGSLQAEPLAIIEGGV